MKRDRSIALALLGLLALVYCIVVGVSLSRAYIDLGEGNYLYTSSRMADGLAIYRDFLSPQPPLHLLTGSVLIRLGRLWGDPLMTVRVFSMILHLATMALIFLLGWRLVQNPYGGVLSALIYMVLPIGFWWSLGYQSELLEIFWLLSALLFLLPLRKPGATAAGVLMALAVLTNMTAAPYALAILVYLAVRHPRRLFPFFFLSFAVTLTAVISYYQTRTGAYFQNVILNQVGSYPKDNLRGYALDKLSGQGMKILFREGGYILVALLGLVLYNRRETRPDREFLVWYAPALLLSAVYVTKGGTMDYIFVLGEPVVALFAAYFVWWFLDPLLGTRPPRESFPRDTSTVPQVVYALLAVLVVGYPGFYFIAETLGQKTFEQREDDLRKVEYYIERYSKPGDRIVAPPYYAFVTGRLLVGEYSELFLWSLKYSTERSEGKEGEGVRKVREIARELEQRRVPIVVAEVNPGPQGPRYPLSEWISQPGSVEILRSDEIRSAIERYYKPVLKPGDLFQTLNFRLQIFVLKTDEEMTR